MGPVRGADGGSIADRQLARMRKTLPVWLSVEGTRWKDVRQLRHGEGGTSSAIGAFSFQHGSSIQTATKLNLNILNALLP